MFIWLFATTTVVSLELQITPCHGAMVAEGKYETNCKAAWDYIWQKATTTLPRYNMVLHAFKGKRNETQNQRFYPIQTALGYGSTQYPGDMINNKGCLNWDCSDEPSLPDIFIDFIQAEKEMFPVDHGQLNEVAEAFKKKLPFFRWLTLRDQDISAKMLLLQSQDELLARRLAIQKAQCEQDLHDLRLHMNNRENDLQTRMNELEFEIGGFKSFAVACAIIYCIWTAWSSNRI